MYKIKEIPKYIYYAKVIDEGDRSVGIFERTIIIKDENSKDPLIDNTVIAEDDVPEMLEDYRNQLKEAMEIIMDNPYVIFDFEE